MIKSKGQLLVPDALASADWRDNPDVKLDMISYLGFPILLPTGEVFGTICVLDSKENTYSGSEEQLVRKFRDLVQMHLGLVYMNHALGEKNRHLGEYLAEIQSLRGLIPICAVCKKIKDDNGFWRSVETYLTKHPEADFTHGYCPECAKKAFSELEERAKSPRRRRSDSA